MFLWAFGSVVETRIGSARFLLIYFFCIFVSNLFDVMLLNIQANHLKTCDIIGSYHALGASGAIAGIMGIFVVRCFFTQVAVALPIFSLPFFSLPINVHGIFLIGLFFILDVSGSVTQMQDETGTVDYWAHIGGYLCGFCIAYLMKLHIDGSRESVYSRAEKFGKNEFGAGQAIKIYGEILEVEPNNTEALEYRFRKYHISNKKEAAQLFGQLVKLYAIKDSDRAIELVEEYYPEYLNTLPGEILLRVGYLFKHKYDIQRARLCLELAENKKGPWQPKSMIALSEIFLEMNLPQRAEILLLRVLKYHKNMDFGDEARRLLKEIQITQKRTDNSSTDHT